MDQFPPILEAILLQHIKGTYAPTKGGPTFTDQDIKYFAKGARLLSDAFTEDRNSLPVNYFNNPVLRSGYLLYFLPVNFLKIVRIMKEFSPQELTRGQIRILDLGAGPGTGMLGMMAFYAEMIRQKRIKDAWLDFTLIDQNYPVLKDAHSLHDAYKDHLEGQFAGFKSFCSVKNYDLRRGGLERFLRNFKYHVIILQNFLNEFHSHGDQLAIVSQLIKHHLEPKTGKLVIIEPALRNTARNLQTIRDQLVKEERLAHVHAPCLHQDVCPLNHFNQRDWCHFYLSWKCPNFIRKVDRLIGNKKDWLALSYLVLGLAERDWQATFKRPEQTWRVISNLMPSKGKKEVVLCGPPGRYHLSRLDKDRSTANKEFAEIHRGDLAEFDAGAPKGFRVDGESRVGRGEKIKILKRI